MTVSIANLTSTWIDSNTTYDGIGLDVTGTGYNVSSKVFRLAFNGQDIFSISANGNQFLATNSILSNTVVYTENSYGLVNAAFTQSNNEVVRLSGSYTKVNSAYLVANAAYGQVNTVATSANAYALATATSIGSSGNAYALSIATSTSSSVGSSANAYAAATYSTLTQFGSVFGVANASFGKANSVAISANAYASAVGQAANAYAASITASYTGALSSSQITGALGYTPYNATNPSGYITSSGSAGSLSGVVLGRFVYGDGTRGKSTGLNSASANSLTLPSGFYFGNSTTGFPTTDWWNMMACIGDSWSSPDSYGYQMVASFWGDDYRLRRVQSGNWQNWRRILIDDTWINDKYFGSDGIIYSNTSMRAPIFYDQNDTGYYCNPNDSSNFVRVYTNDWFRAYGVKGLYSQDYGNHWYSTDTGYWSHGGNGSRGYGGIRILSGYESGIKGYVYWDSSGFGLLNSAGGWGFRMEDGANNCELYRIAYANDIRPYIMYDRNDTGYYCDPNSTSRMNTVHSNNTYIQPGYMLHSGHGAWQGEYNKIQWHSTHLYLQNNGGGYLMILRRGDGGERFWVDYNGNMVASGNVSAYSDERLKENIKTITDPLEIIKKLRGVTFSWIKTQQPSYGLIAQEVEKVIPELVLESENGTADGDEKMTVKSVDYSKIVSVLIEGMKEQQKMIDMIMKTLDMVV